MDNVETALEYLGRLHKETKREWNSVIDVYPKGEEYVICCTENGVLVYGCWFSYSTRTWYGYGSSQPETNITHWMRYPKGPAHV